MRASASGSGQRLTAQQRSTLPKALAHVRLPKRSTDQLPKSIIRAHPSRSLSAVQSEQSTVRLDLPHPSTSQDEDHQSPEPGSLQQPASHVVEQPHDGVRTSSRTSTMASKVLLRNRLEQDHRRKQQSQAQSAQRSRLHAERSQVPLTQERLIAEALEVEETNRASLRRLLKREELLRKRAKVVQKHEIEGPFLRWHSIGMFPPTTAMVGQDLTKAVSGPDAAGSKPDPEERGPVESTGVPSSNPAPKMDAEINSIDLPLQDSQGPTAPEGATVPATLTEVSTSNTHKPNAVPQGSGQNKGRPPTPTGRATDEVVLDPVLAARVESIRLRGLPNTEGDRDPPGSPTAPSKEGRTFLSLHALPMAWEDDWLHEWNCVLGSHADWSSPILVPVRNRPHRPLQSICPFWGAGALYRDARTDVPLANLDAARALKQIENGEFLWTGLGAQPERDSDSGANSGLVPGSNGTSSPANALDFGAFVASRLDQGAAGVFSAFWAKAEAQITEVKDADPNQDQDHRTHEARNQDELGHASENEPSNVDLDLDKDALPSSPLSALPGDTSSRPTSSRSSRVIRSVRGKDQKGQDQRQPNASDSTERQVQDDTLPVPAHASPPSPEVSDGRNKKRKISKAHDPTSGPLGINNPSKRRRSSTIARRHSEETKKEASERWDKDTDAATPMLACDQPQDTMIATETTIPTFPDNPDAAERVGEADLAALPPRARKQKRRYEYTLAPVVAPGDERALVARALELPGRSTRSGRARADPAPKSTRSRGKSKVKETPLDSLRPSSLPELAPASDPSASSSQAASSMPAPHDHSDGEEGILPHPVAETGLGHSRSER